MSLSAWHGVRTGLTETAHSIQFGCLRLDAVNPRRIVLDQSFLAAVEG